MKIAFICGSLEAGCDGVGDYVMCLIKEIIKQGHSATAIAINDHDISDKKSSFSQSASGCKILRLPAFWTIQQKYLNAKEWIQEVNPDFLSLQFVPFSFDKKGLPFDLANILVKLGEKRPWHIMFHELWVGMDKKASVKHIVWGRFQRLLIRSMIKKLQPLVIHTQTRLYQSQLKNLGFNSAYLPLFSNIAVSPEKIFDEKLFGRNSANISFVMFGGIHYGAPVKEFTLEVAQLSKIKGVEVSLKLIGRCGPFQHEWINEWKLLNLPIENLGEQPAEKVSATLRNASVGISTTPYFLIEKSGSAAAMKAHGLPVVCVSRIWEPAGIKHPSSPAGIQQYKKGNLKNLDLQKTATANDNIADIARQFSNSLLTINKNGRV